MFSQIHFHMQSCALSSSCSLSGCSNYKKTNHAILFRPNDVTLVVWPIDSSAESLLARKVGSSTASPHMQHVDDAASTSPMRPIYSAAATLPVWQTLTATTAPHAQPIDDYDAESPARTIDASAGALPPTRPIDSDVSIEIGIMHGA